jgi:hypothetical protein
VITGKGSIHKHGSGRSEVAGNLGAKFPGNAVNRSFNTLARGQFLQACPEILIVRGDYLIASKVPYDSFLLAPRMTLIVLNRYCCATKAPTSGRWMQPQSVGANRPP